MPFSVYLLLKKALCLWCQLQQLNIDGKKILEAKVWIATARSRSAGVSTPLPTDADAGQARPGVSKIELDGNEQSYLLTCPNIDIIWQIAILKRLFR